MGSGCYSTHTNGDNKCAGPATEIEIETTQNHEHDHEEPRDSSDCANEVFCPDDESCAEETCCDGEYESSNCSVDVKPECCSSTEEHCDEKCIIAAAATECKTSCENNDDDDAAHDSAAGHHHAHDEDGQHPASACSSHLLKAYEQYSAYLETARCICRSILDRGLPTTCCVGTGKSAAAPASSRHKYEVIEAHSTAHSHSARKHQTGHHHHHHHGQDVKRRGKMARATDRGNKMAIEPVTDDRSDHCSGHDVLPPVVSEKGIMASRVKEIDIEKDAGLEHVALIVDGMTCSGCGNKLDRTLKAMPGVSGVRVNFVMGNAEFSIDPEVVKAEDVIRGASRATGFYCTRMASDDQTLDVLASGPAVKVLMDMAILGVNQVTTLDKKMVRLTYDPAIIGARTLVNKIGDISSGLAPPRDDPSVASGRKRLYDQLLKTSVSAVLTIPVVVLAWGDTLVDEKTRAYISIVLASLVQLIAVPDFYRPAISALVHSGTIEMDLLVVISITAAYVYSVVAFSFRMADQPLETSEFFETSTLLITLVLLGRFVAAFARIRAVAAVSLRVLQASTAVIVENGKDIEIDARLLQYGDKFKVLPHSSVPTDGLVLDGSSEVDESMLTGESVPVPKKKRDAVIAGTINGSGTLLAQLTRLPGKNTVTDIAELVEEAANSKPRIQDVADRVASWFVPVVSSVAIIVTIVWLVIGLKVRNLPTGKAISDAITYAVAVLAVSCPCALGLAVPMVLVVAGGIAARGGVIIKSAECTERARKVTDVVFDKTGTITEGELDVLEEEFFDSNYDEAISITKAIIAGNKHPVSLAVSKHLQTRPSSDVKITDVRVIPGAGVEAAYNGTTIRAGNPTWTNTTSLPYVTRLQVTDMTLLVVTRNSIPIASFGLRTRLRPEAARVVAQLSQRNIDVHLVSGDQSRAVASVAAQALIPNIAAQRNPAQKRDYVASLMAQGRIVMFVGDGTNDAVAVTQADVGVHLGSAASASDVTRGAADVVLLAGLEGIEFLFDVSRASFHRMVFNFVWSAIYNVLAILLASGAFVNVRIPPAYAGLGEIVSVLPVIFAATTMLMMKIAKA
ncbi:copper-translocating P-type ATPase [Polytolypa hystricis UAMH7299]|uniref:Copper-translocating P-type ATPase n=1 Tax=Polytolypa hystricis (strain UAMH7299) TaxID=1447883 RepID=A0A2B7YH18_POLH7|nr:copper-translocating P-type ATPase [Polytolypa hystricis UAMH7299]